MTTQKVAIDQVGYRKAVRHGIAAAVWIAILTFAEFAVFHFFENSDYLLWLLLPFVLAKGWIILDAFMHIGALWGSDH